MQSWRKNQRKLKGEERVLNRNGYFIPYAKTTTYNLIGYKSAYKI